MKKPILLFLALTVTLSAVSCRIVSAKSNETEISATTSGTPEPYPGFDPSDCKGYLAFIENGNHMIPHERLQFLGEFDEISFGRYSYSYKFFVNREKNQFYQLIIYEGYKDYSGVPSREPPTDDLRTFAGNTALDIVDYVIENEICYTYYGDELEDIYWNSGGYRFWLCNNRGLSWYPDDGSLVSRLLNKNTALEAKAEFDAMVFGEE